MKKLVALLLSVVLMISVLPLNVFAMNWDSIVSISFADTYVYDGMQEDGGKFEQFYVKIITTFEDGSTSEEDRIAYRNGGVEVNWGTLYLSDNQDTETWEVGNTYQVTGTVGSFTNTFNVEVRENPIQEIFIDDFNVVKSNMCYSEEYGDVYRIRDLLNGCHSCVALYKDGSRTEFSHENLSFGEYYISVDLIVTCDIPYEDWEVGNTYEVTASLLGVADTFSVTVLEIESFEVEDVECIQNFDGNRDGYWNENDNYVENAWFNYNIYPDNITVTFTNGSSISGDSSVIAEYTGFYPNCYSDQSYENQWGLGNHTATINICGYEQNYTVKVVETPIKDIIIDDITYIEGTNRWNDGPNYYEYYINPETLTVVLKDDTVITGTYNDVCEQLGYYGDCSSDQSYENLWGVGEHKATINLMGYVKEYSINIIKSPISSIEIEDIEILECTHGDYNDKENYMYFSFSPTFSVTFSDGSVKSGLTEGITIDEEYYSLEIRDYTDQYVSPWVVGNTYEIIGSIFGVSDTFNVTIKESPVESLSISDISIVENTKGYIETGFEESYYHYCYFYPDFSVTLKNGDIINSNGSSVEIGGEWYSLSIDESIQYNEPWTVGNTYEVTGSILGVSDTFNVTITEAPIESIEIEDITIVEYSNGYYEDGTFYYSMPNLTATVTYKDNGETEIINGGIYINDDWYSIDTSAWDIQHEQPWVAGEKYTVTGTLLGVEDTFNVAIIESPVENIVLEDIVLIQGIDSYNNGDHEEYYCNPVLSEVTFNNGIKAEIIADDSIKYMGNYYPVQSNLWEMQKEEPWAAGETYTVTGTLLGVTTTFNVTIVENPIEELQVIKKPDKREYLQGEHFNLKGTVIRIQYTDSSYEDVAIEDDYTSSYYKRFYSKKLDRTCYIVAMIDPEAIGQQNVELELFGQTCEIPITVRENLMESISIKENADKSITITVTNSDDTSYDMNLLDITRIWGSHEDEYYGTIFTDYGEFDAVIYAKEDSFAIGINLPAEHIKSNIISGSDWFKAVVSAFGYSWNMACHYDMDILETQHFSGEITPDNFDDIVSFAAYLFTDYEKHYWWVSPDGVEYMVYAGKDVRDAMKKLFGIENIDLTLSQNYDSETDTYKTTKYPMIGDEWSKASPSKIKYNNGVWEIESSHWWDDETVVYLKLNNEQQIISFDINEQKAKHTVGDIDGDEEITDWDGVMLARYLAGWNVEITTLDALDIDGDGEITDWDGVVLDRYLAGWNVSIG